MKVLRISVDEKPINCLECPLTNPHTRDCGEMKELKGNASRRAYKVPDQRCKLIILN